MGYAHITISALDLSPDVGAAPRRIIDFIAYNPLFGRTILDTSNQIKPSDSIWRDTAPTAADPSRDTPSSASAVMDSRILPCTTGSHCLSLAPSSRRTHPNRDGSCSYISISPQSLSFSPVSYPPAHLIPIPASAAAAAALAPFFVA